MPLEPEERAEAMRKLKQFFAEQPVGAVVGYLDIEIKTGVDMKTSYGRSLARQAMDRIGRTRKTIPKFGWELSSPDNANELARTDRKKFANTVSRIRERADALVSEHADNMTQYERNRLLEHQAIFNTALIASSGGGGKLAAKDS